MSVDILTGYSYSEDPQTIIREAASGFTEDPGTILYFSPVSVFEKLTQAISLRFPNSRTYGVSTYYSFFEGRNNGSGYGAGTVIIGFGDSFDCSGGVIEDIKMHPVEFAPAIDKELHKVPEENTVCLTFTTAFYGAEELVLDTIASVIGNRDIHVAGSSSGNEKWERTTFVSYNGRVFSSASIFLFVHNRNGRIAVLKQDMFVPMRAEFRATSVDIRKHIIYELDGKPAAAELAKQLHYELYELNEHLHDYGLGRKVGKTLYTTDILKITREKGLEMLAAVYGGMKLCLLERGKYDKCLSNMVAGIRKKIPTPRFMLYVNCISLTTYYQNIGWMDIFTAGLGTLAPAFAGISGYGEQLDRVNINKTLMGIAFE